MPHAGRLSDYSLNSAKKPGCAAPAFACFTRNFCAVLKLKTFAAERKRLRHPARADAAPPVPDAATALLRLVAEPVPLSELPAVAQAAGIKRPVAQSALSAGLRTGAVTLSSVGGVVCVVATEVAP
jgi:hypothetical protein